MRFFKEPNIARDAIFLLLLIAGVHIILERNSKIYIQQLKNAYSTHEIDPHFLTQIELLHHQLQTVVTFLDKVNNKELNEKFGQKLIAMKDNAAEIFKKYGRRRPAVALLGPIGTLGIVMTEQELEKKVLELAHDTEKLLHNLAQVKTGHSIGFKRSSSLSTALHAIDDSIVLITL